MFSARSWLSAIALGAVVMSYGVSHAQDNSGSVLFVAPHRLIVEPAEKVDIITVSNKSDRARRYDLTMVDQVMGEDGITMRKDTFEYSAKNLVKFVPRRFSLQPGERQTIRIMVTRPETLAAGDYHSHLLFREVPLSVKDKEQLKDERAAAENAVSFEIRTLYGIAVPVIVQQGAIDGKIEVAGLSLGMTADGKQRQLSADFNRSGNSEAAVKFSAAYEQSGQEPVPVVEGQWVRIYREVNKITKQFPLVNLPADAKGGKIVVSLQRDENDPANVETMEVPLN